ncbi:DUF2637 domain-containing protein [Nonomuraea glycinis]|uniref:DUF2637 domain-containing protein n=1 Tax=Nonomuraea glycinis TaxID=2047744 RepID=UPI002E0F9C72|nr:DUF2637 domain-containing protein [Nonomuraea glycinis]
MIRFLTAAVVILLAGVAAVVSYRHAYEVVVANGEAGFTAILVPLTIDGLIFASSMVLLDAARRGGARPVLAYLSLVLGILATLAANVMHGWAHGPVGAIVAAWPAVALVLAYELLMGLIRRSTVTDVTVEAVAARDEVEAETLQAVEGFRLETVQVHEPVVPVQVEPVALAADRAHVRDLEESAPEVEVRPDPVPEPDLDAPYRPVAVATFLAEVAQGETPTVRRIKDTMNVSTDRAGRLRRYLSTLVEVAQ